MKAELVCIPCILDDVIGAVGQLGLASETRRQIVREVLAYLGGCFDTSRPPSDFITEAHRIVKRVSGIAVPFAEPRDLANRVGRDLAEGVRSEIARLTDEERFHRLVRFAIAGNELDFRTIGTGYGLSRSDIDARLRDAAGRELALDEVAQIRDAAREASEVLFIHDNVGEIAFDKLLIEELNRAGSRVTSALRGGAITSDATVDDGREMGIGDVARVIEAGPDTLGISFPEMSPDLRGELSRADLVISKGQANYYVLSEFRAEVPGRIAFLLRTKCDLVASKFSQEGKVSIAVLR